MKAQTRVTALVVASLVLANVPSALAVEDSAQIAVNKAHRFLATAQRGKDILGYLHFGADYRGHEYRETVPVGSANDGRFALIYRFWWENDGLTDVAFLCDPRGNVEEVRVTYTNARFSQPFPFSKPEAVRPHLDSHFLSIMGASTYDFAAAAQLFAK